MANILSQEEVDALLEAVDKGELAVDEEEVDVAEQEQVVGEYDFRRPNVLTKDQIQGFSDIHQSFASEVQTGLSILLRRNVDLKLVSTEQQQYSEFINSLSDITHLLLFSVAPLPGVAVMEVNLSLVFGMIDLLLGGEGDIEASLRTLTEVEIAVLTPVVETICSQLALAWEDVLEVDISVLSTQSNPQYVRAAPPDAPIVVFGFDVKAGFANGIINICYPLPMVQALIKELNSKSGQLDNYYGAQTGSSRDDILSALRTMLLPVTANLGSTLLPARDVMALRPGDVVVFDTKACSALPILVQNHPVFKGVPGTVRRNVGLKITDFAAIPPLEEEDRVDALVPTEAAAVGEETAAEEEESNG